MSATATVRSYAVATFMLGRGYQVLGAELSAGAVVFRFAAADVAKGMREYQAAKVQLDGLAAIVSGGA